MARAVDVAALILDRAPRGRATTFTVQKLVYYVQAWSLAWLDKPAFEDAVQAWKDGPVEPNLYAIGRGEYEISRDHLAVVANRAAVSPEVARVVHAVWEAYGGLSGTELSSLTHREAPWRAARARGGAKLGQRSSAPISHESMREFYRLASLSPFLFDDAYKRGIRLLASMPDDLAESFLSDDDEEVEVADNMDWLLDEAAG